MAASKARSISLKRSACPPVSAAARMTGAQAAQVRSILPAPTCATSQGRPSRSAARSSIRSRQDPMPDHLRQIPAHDRRGRGKEHSLDPLEPFTPPPGAWRPALSDHPPAAPPATPPPGKPGAGLNGAKCQPRATRPVEGWSYGPQDAYRQTASHDRNAISSRVSPRTEVMQPGIGAMLSGSPCSIVERLGMTGAYPL